jgi:hypothetical protein
MVEQAKPIRYLALGVAARLAKVADQPLDVDIPVRAHPTMPVAQHAAAIFKWWDRRNKALRRRPDGRCVHQVDLV